MLVKLLFTAVDADPDDPGGQALLPGRSRRPARRLSLALLILSTLSILSIGFLIASLVPTARFAQPVGTLILYPMIGLSGLFVPLASLPPALRRRARCFRSPTPCRCSTAS